MKYLLDTNICIHALKGHQAVVRRLLAHQRPDVAISVITEAELRAGAAKSDAPQKTLRAVENFLHPISILPLVSEDTIAYAMVRSRLERAGTPIGPLDTLIAGHAVGRKLVLVTNNEREFSRVAGLRIENWTT
jgi:tRNA(fMet)-specific endonuclease VapC